MHETIQFDEGASNLSELNNISITDLKYNVHANAETAILNNENNALHWL